MSELHNRLRLLPDPIEVIDRTPRRRGVSMRVAACLALGLVMAVCFVGGYLAACTLNDAGW